MNILMENQLHLILARLSMSELKQRLKILDSVYHITEDRQVRQKMLLFMDELKLELNKRGINWKN